MDQLDPDPQYCFFHFNSGWLYSACTGTDLFEEILGGAKNFQQGFDSVKPWEDCVPPACCRWSRTGSRWDGEAPSPAAC
jgi:hypothetical protein